MLITEKQEKLFQDILEVLNNDLNDNQFDLTTLPDLHHAFLEYAYRQLIIPNTDKFDTSKCPLIRQHIRLAKDEISYDKCREEVREERKRRMKLLK